MTKSSDMALLAAGSYWDVRKGEFDTTTGKDTIDSATVNLKYSMAPSYEDDANHRHEKTGP